VAFEYSESEFEKLFGAGVGRPRVLGREGMLHATRRLVLQPWRVAEMEMAGSL
jgi:hypothetical protein